MKYIISIFMLIFILAFLAYAYKDIKEDFKLSKNKGKSKNSSLGSTKIKVNPMYYKTK